MRRRAVCLLLVPCLAAVPKAPAPKYQDNQPPCTPGGPDGCSNTPPTLVFQKYPTPMTPQEVLQDPSGSGWGLINYMFFVGVKRNMRSAKSREISGKHKVVMDGRSRRDYSPLVDGPQQPGDGGYEPVPLPVDCSKKTGQDKQLCLTDSTGTPGNENPGVGAEITGVLGQPGISAGTPTADVSLPTSGGSKGPVYTLPDSTPAPRPAPSSPSPPAGGQPATGAPTRASPGLHGVDDLPDVELKPFTAEPSPPPPPLSPPPSPPSPAAPVPFGSKLLGITAAAADELSKSASTLTATAEVPNNPYGIPNVCFEIKDITKEGRTTAFATDVGATALYCDFLRGLTAGFLDGVATGRQRSTRSFLLGLNQTRGEAHERAAARGAAVAREATREALAGEAERDSQSMTFADLRPHPAHAAVSLLGSVLPPPPPPPPPPSFPPGIRYAQWSDATRMREEPFTLDLSRLRELSLTGEPPYREGPRHLEKDPIDLPRFPGINGPDTAGGFPGNAQRGEPVNEEADSLGG